jgi:hypothetical protein
MSGDAAIRIADDGNLRAGTAEGKESRRKKKMGMENEEGRDSARKQQASG